MTIEFSCEVELGENTKLNLQLDELHCYFKKAIDELYRRHGSGPLPRIRKFGVHEWNRPHGLPSFEVQE